MEAHGGKIKDFMSQHAAQLNIRSVSIGMSLAEAEEPVGKCRLEAMKGTEEVCEHEDNEMKFLCKIVFYF